MLTLLPTEVDDLSGVTYQVGSIGGIRTQELSVPECGKYPLVMLRREENGALYLEFNQCGGCLCFPLFFPSLLPSLLPSSSHSFSSPSLSLLPWEIKSFCVVLAGLELIV